MDCSQLFKLELEKKQLELDLMKQSLRAANQQLDELKRSGREAEDSNPPANPVKKVRGTTEARARGIPPL
jgi:protein subunit release factor B